MKNKKILSAAMAMGLAATLMACGNTANQPAENTATEVEETEIVETQEEAAEVANDPTSTEETTEGLETEDASDIYALNFGYIPENFVENYSDEKTDLRTVEYGAEKNPAKKIMIQISDNEERFAELVTAPDDAEDITIDGDPAKYWDDGSFNYVVVSKGANHIYARSTLERDETITVVEEIK